MTLNMNNGRVRFFRIQDINTQANLCKNSFYPESIKNDNETVATRKIVRCEKNQQLHQIKKMTMQLNIRLAKLCNYILFFVLIELQASSFTQNETPKMVKNVRNFAEHAFFLSIKSYHERIMCNIF